MALRFDFYTGRRRSCPASSRVISFVFTLLLASCSQTRDARLRDSAAPESSGASSAGSSDVASGAALEGADGSDRAQETGIPAGAGSQADDHSHPHGRSHAEPSVATQHVLKEIAPGVWFREGDLVGHGHCNNGFVVFDDFVLVIDANFPDGAEACLADIRQVTQLPVRFVFDTHHHGDHAYGNTIWARAGAVPVAHEKVAEEMDRYEPERWRQTARPDVQALGQDGPMQPTLRFLDRLVADDGTRRVEFLHFGTAHTRGDGFAWLPEEKILFTGDAVVNGPYNYMGDGDTASWLRVIDELKKLGAETVAPGHGPVADASLIGRQRAFIAFLRNEVEAGVKAGKTLGSIQAAIEVPEELSLYAGGMLADQIAKIYAELTER